jgi:hypothetical protein
MILHPRSIGAGAGSAQRCSRTAFAGDSTPRHIARAWAAPGATVEDAPPDLSSVRYLPISTPNSTACRSAFQRATSGRVNNIGAHDRARVSFGKFSIHSAKTATNGAGCLSSLFMADRLAGSGAWEGTDALAGTACCALRRIGAHRVRPRGSRAKPEPALSASRASRHQRYALTRLAGLSRR